MAAATITPAAAPAKDHETPARSITTPAIAVPMADVFDLKQKTWTYTATASRMLVGTGLPLPPSVAKLKPLEPTHNAAYWARVTQGMDFRVEDHFSFARYNHILWKGLMGGRPYPKEPTGINLSYNRTALLRRYGISGRKYVKSQ